MRVISKVPQNPEPSNRGRLFFWAKVVVTISILAFLLLHIDLLNSAYAIRESLGIWLLIAFLSNSLALIISTYKWDSLLRAVGISASKRALLKLYTIGFFASSFLPGVVGGDVVRWHLAGQHTGRRLKVAATILIERFTGVVALVLVCVVAVITIAPQFATSPVLILLAGMSLALALGLALVLNRQIATVLMYRLRHSRFGTIMIPLYKLHRTLRSFPKRPILVALAYSLLFYLSVGFTFFLICKAFGIDIAFVQATAEQALICLLTLIPISVGGLGLAQAGDVYLLGILGVSAAHAFGISIMRQIIAYGYVIIGGFLFIRWKAVPPSGKARNLRVTKTPSGSFVRNIGKHIDSQR